MIDYIVLALIAVSFVFGMVRGIVSQLAAVAGIVLAYVFAPEWGRRLGPFFQNEFGGTRFFADKIAILLIAVGIYIAARLIGFLIDRLLTKRVQELTKLNRLGGGLFGIVKCAAIIAIGFFFLGIVPTEYLRHWAPKVLESKTFRFAEKYNPMGRQAVLDQMRGFRTVVSDAEKMRRFRKDPQTEKILNRHRLNRVLNDQRLIKTFQEGDYDRLRETENIEKLMQDEELTGLLDRLSRSSSNP